MHSVYIALNCAAKICMQKFIINFFVPVGGKKKEKE